MGAFDFFKSKGGKKKGHRDGNNLLTTTDPDISPDGDSAAFGFGDPSTEKDQVRCLRPDLTFEFTIIDAFSPAIGNDCSTVAFAAFDDQFNIDIYLRIGNNRIPVTTEGGVPNDPVGPNTGPPFIPVVDLTPDACFITFVTTAPLVPELDQNGQAVDDGGSPDVYVRSFSQGNVGACANARDEPTHVSRGIDVGEFDRVLAPTISDDGRFIAFAVETVTDESGDDSVGEARIFLWDRDQPGDSTLVAEGAFSDGLQFSEDELIPSLPMVSANGDFVVFSLDDSDGVRQVYRLERGSIQPIQVSPSAGPNGTGSFEPSISRDGQFISFTSNDPLVRGDTNGQEDVFVWDADSGDLTRASVDEFGDEADARDGVGSRSSSISADGDVVAFVTDSPSLLESAQVPRTAPGFEAPDGEIRTNTLAPQLLLNEVVFEDLRKIAGTGSANNIVGSPAEELIEGFGGGDRISGRGGDDRIFAGAGRDSQIRGDGGNDLLDGGSGKDTLLGGNGLDRLKGRGGNDTMRGGEGNDRLDGGPGDDAMFGDAGNDTLEGGAGNDVLRGGLGRDVFVYNRFAASVQNSLGRDQISGFTDDDTIRLVNFDSKIGDESRIVFEGIDDFSDLGPPDPSDPPRVLRLREERGDTIIDLSDAFRDPFTGALPETPSTITVIGVTGLRAEDFDFQ